MKINQSKVVMCNLALEYAMETIKDKQIEQKKNKTNN